MLAIINRKIKNIIFRSVLDKWYFKLNLQKNNLIYLFTSQQII